jgi:tryptophan-rich sensory protein
MILRLTVFLAINIVALGLGGLFTNNGVQSEWYLSIAKAPWTPPGWVFGTAWTTIMICFSFYLTYLWPNINNKNFLISLFILQLILNVSWNPVFFHFQYVLFGLIIITSLTILIGFFLFYYWSELKILSLLIIPYFVWLIIATSLNAYILFNN